MRNRVFVIILVFITLLLMGSFIITEKDDYSEVENRYLNDFSISNPGGYLSDHFPGRYAFLKLKNTVQTLLGRRYINGIYVASDGYLIPEYLGSSKKDYVIDVINGFASGKTVDVMLVPDSILINEDKLSDCLLNGEREDIEYFYSKLNTNNIGLTDSFIKENAVSNNLYYRTDHHWTSHGAHLAYQLYMNDIGLLADDSYTVKTVSDSFLGTSASSAIGLGQKEEIVIYDYGNDLEVEYVKENIKTDSLYNTDYLNKKDKYAMFLDGNHALIKITNRSLEEGSIVVIKNSYANCFIPFIVNNFRNVYVVDLRYYNDSVSELMENEGIERALILYNLNNLYSDLSLIKLK